MKYFKKFLVSILIINSIFNSLNMYANENTTNQNVLDKATPMDKTGTQYILIKMPTTSVPIRGTKINIKISDNIPLAEKQYIEELFKEIYPLIEEVAGEPYKNQDLTIKYEEGAHTSLSKDLSCITLGKLPDPNKSENNFFDSVMIVELFHVFLKGTNWGDFARPYEYYSWAIANLISEYSYANDLPRKFTPAIGRAATMTHGLQAYIDRRKLGLEVYSGTESVKYYNNLFLDQVANMFSIMLFTQSESMENLDFYKRFNSALYKYTDQGKSNALELAMNEVQKQPIEGMNLYEWFKSQPYRVYKVPSNGYAFKLLPVEGELYYPKLTKNYDKVYIILMELGSDGNYQTRTPIESADIQFRFYNKQGKVLAEDIKKIDMKNMQEKMADYIPIPDQIRAEPYVKLVATASINGKTLKSEVVVKNK